MVKGSFATGLAAVHRRSGRAGRRAFDWTRIGARLAFWSARARQRRALAELDDHLLADIGVDRAAVRREAARPFWR